MVMVFCPCGIFKSNLCLPRYFFRCVHLLWLHTAAIKTLRYSQTTVRSRINTARPVPSSNYRHRAKLHSRDLLNLINILFEFNSIHLFFSLYIIKSLPYLSFWFSLFELNVLSFISLSLSLHHQITPIWPFLSFDQLCPVSLTRLNFAARKTSDIYCPSTWWCGKEWADC